MRAVPCVGSSSVHWWKGTDLAVERSCGNVASILELDENLNSNYKTFDAAAQVRDRTLRHLFLSPSASEHSFLLALTSRSKIRETSRPRVPRCSTSCDLAPAPCEVRSDGRSTLDVPSPACAHCVGLVARLVRVVDAAAFARSGPPRLLNPLYSVPISPWLVFSLSPYCCNNSRLFTLDAGVRLPGAGLVSGRRPSQGDRENGGGD